VVGDEGGYAARAVVSPLLANVYLHYVFDLWIEAWRKKVADGDVIVVRYADDLVVGFEHRTEAERFLQEFRERLAKFGLELNAEKTRLIEFGRWARRNRQARGEGEPESFTFLGFTHYSGINRAGKFTLRRQTARKRLEAKLQQVKQTLRARMHEPVSKVGEWLRRGAERLLPIPRGAGKLGSPETLPVADRTLLAARPPTAQPTRPNHSEAHGSIIRPLAHPAPSGASLPQRAL